MSRAEHLVEVNEGDFEKEVMKSGIPVLVDFFTPPCAPCKALVPVLERTARKYPNVKVFKVNAWNNQSLCARLKIVGVPALLFLSPDKTFSESTGSTTRPNDGSKTA